MILVSVEDFIGQYKLAQSQGDNVVIQSYIDREEKTTIYKLLGKTLGDLLIAYLAATPAFIITGPLVVGQWYQINELVSTDDFTNVGAASNTNGVKFIATGTTPTVWTNASRINVLTNRFENLLSDFYFDDDTDEWFDWDQYYECFGVHKSTGIKDLLLMQIYYCYLSEEQIIHSQSGIVSQTAENSAVQSPAQAFRKGEQKWNESGLDTWYGIRWYCKVKYPEVYPEFKGQFESTRYSSLI